MSKMRWQGKRNAGLVLLILIAGLGTEPGRIGIASAFANGYPIPESAPERIASVLVRSSKQVSEPGRPSHNRTSYGSGTIIGKWRGRYAVLTCSHILLNEGRHTVQADGVVYNADLIAIDPKPDLALLVFSARRSFPCIPLAAQSPRAECTVRTCGYPGAGTLTANLTVVQGYQGNRNVVLRFFNQIGESGGGVFRNGELTGIMWGHDKATGTTLGTIVEQAHSFLKNNHVQFDRGASLLGTGPAPTPGVLDPAPAPSFFPRATAPTPPTPRLSAGTSIQPSRTRSLTSPAPSADEPPAPEPQPLP